MKFLHIFVYFVSESMHVIECASQRTTPEVFPLLSLCMSWALNSGCQAGQQGPLLAEPNWQPCYEFVFFNRGILFLLFPNCTYDPGSCFWSWVTLVSLISIATLLPFQTHRGHLKPLWWSVLNCCDLLVQSHGIETNLISFPSRVI